MKLSFDSFSRQFLLTLQGEASHTVTLGQDPVGNITRINHALEGMQEKLEGFRSELTETERNLEAAKEAVSKPFPREQELSEKLARLAELDRMLDMGERGMEELAREKEGTSEIVEKDKYTQDTGNTRNIRDESGTKSPQNRDEIKKKQLNAGGLIAAETAGSYMAERRLETARPSVRRKLALFKQNREQEQHPDHRERIPAKHREQSL